MQPQEINSENNNYTLQPLTFHNFTIQTVGINGIQRYCCNCANGNRTVGCCSHVAAAIYYLSHARYLSRIINPAEVLNILFDFEGAQPVIEEDSDDDD